MSVSYGTDKQLRTRQKGKTNSQAGDWIKLADQYVVKTKLIKRLILSTLKTKHSKPS